MPMLQEIGQFNLKVQYIMLLIFETSKILEQKSPSLLIYKSIDKHLHLSYNLSTNEVLL